MNPGQPSNSKATTVEKITFAGKVLLSVAAGVSIGGAGSWYESFMGIRKKLWV